MKRYRVRNLGFKLAFTAWALLSLGILGGSIYVVIHFLRRYW